MSGKFKTIINKSVTDDSGQAYIQVQHKGLTHRVDIMRSEDELREVEVLDNQYFTGNQKISLEELQHICSVGRVLAYRNEISGKVIAVSQVLLSSTPRQEVRMGEAFSYGTAGRGFGQIMYKAQEVVAREARKHKIRATVRLENTESIRSLLKAGYRITEYDPTRYGSVADNGARLIMEKDLENEQYPFRPEIEAQRVRQGEVPVALSKKQLATVIAEHPERIMLPVHNSGSVDHLSHPLAEMILNQGYTGLAVLQPHEFEYRVEDNNRKVVIFHRRDLPPRADRLAFPVHATSEYGPLREVIVSFTPENAQIKAEHAINAVAIENIDNIDPIAFKDEYNLFVGTLAGQGVRVVQTNAIGRDGKTPIFTRDPAFVLGDTFVAGHLRQAQRVYETEGMIEISSERPRLDLSGEADAFVEGGDVIFIDDKRVVVGIGQRTNMSGLQLLRKHFPNYEFIPVAHTDLHLDVLFTMVGHRKCLADVTRLPEEFIALLETGGFTIIIAEPEEQVTLGCNVVCLSENRVIAAAENATTIQRLREKGVEVVDVSMPNLIKWGGGPRCMTCPTHRE